MTTKTIDERMTELRSIVEPLLGGESVLSDINENASDPFVQLVLAPIAGLVQIEKIVEKNRLGLGLCNMSCDDILEFMSDIGVNINGKRSEVDVVFIGDNGVVNNGMSISDCMGRKWLLKDRVQVSNGIGFGVLQSDANGPFDMKKGFIDTVLGSGFRVVNASTPTLGNVAMTCDDMRKSLSSFTIGSYIETDNGVINKVLSLDGVIMARFIGKFESCDGSVNCGKPGFVVLGGDKDEITNVIELNAPINSALLTGNEIGSNGVKIIRPCPVIIDIEYHGDCVNEDKMKELFCDQQNLKVSSSYFSSMINGLSSVSFKALYQKKTGSGSNINSVSGCDGSHYDMVIDGDCVCTADKEDDESYSQCIELEDYEFAVIGNIKRLDGEC